MTRMRQAAPIPYVTVDLDKQGRLLVPGTTTPVPDTRVAEHLGRQVRVPMGITDIYVYVHGWQTAPAAAVQAAQYLVGRAQRLHAERPEAYGKLTNGYRPWCVVVRWPSSSPATLGGYRAVRDRAHAMSHPGTGHASYVLGHLLGYLDDYRLATRGPAVLANQNGQLLHLVGHSFGGRFLCEAVQWAGERQRGPEVLGWSTPRDRRRPFTADSMLVFQMAAPRNAFAMFFPALFPPKGVPGAPLGGPLVLTHSRWDRATGFWHLRAEGVPGIGHSGVGEAPVPQATMVLLGIDTPYALEDLDHRIVSVDAGWRFRGGRAVRLSPAGAHSDYLHLESAHLLLSLSVLSRRAQAANGKRPST